MRAAAAARRSDLVVGGGLATLRPLRRNDRACPNPSPAASRCQGLISYFFPWELCLHSPRLFAGLIARPEPGGAAEFLARLGELELALAGAVHGGGVQR